MSLTKKVNLREGEKIITIIRRYGLVSWWKHLLGLLFLGTTSFFMFQIFAYGLWGYVVYGAGIFMGVFLVFRTWFFDHFNAFVVTTERVIDIHRLGWFDQIVSAVGHKEVKDVSVRKKGVLANMFNYGSVVIQSKGQQFYIEVAKVYDPQKLQTVLLEVGEQYQRDRKLLDAQAVYRNFLKIIPELSDEQLQTASQLIMDQFEEVEEEVEEDVEK
ncbi:MAG: PH domain-containing protein [bacterium]